MKKKINNLIAAFLVMAVGVMGIGTVYADDANTGTPNIDGSTSLPGGSSSTSGNNSSTSGNNSSTSGGSNSTSDAAASLVTVGCNSTELAVGGTTVCTVYVTPNAALANSGATKVVLTVSQSEYLSMTGLNPAAGFKLGSHNEDDKTKSTNTIELTYTATDANPIVANKKMEIMSFNLKLEEAAANVSNGDCGRLCITGAMFDTTNVKVGDDGSYCPNITIVKKNCKDEECNPTTGEFMNYAVIAGVATVALVSIALISKKKKFYNV